MTATLLGGTRAVAPAEIPQYRRIVELESTRSFSDELTAALASSDVRTAARAALALGRTGDARAAGPLRNATSARSVPLRALAVYGYGLLAASATTAPAVPADALRDGAGAVRVAGLDAARRMRAARAAGADALLAPALRLLSNDADPIVRARAATALSSWADAPAATRRAVALRLAAAFRTDAELDVRRHAAWTLRRAFAREAPLAAVRAGLADRDDVVRIQFADLVARRGTLSDIPVLRPLLADASWRVREQAYESIKVLAGLGRTEHLTGLPAVIATPPPEAPDSEPVLPRPHGLGSPRKPTASDAILETPLLPETSAEMTGPMPGPHPRVRIGTTKGVLVLRLYPEWAPLTVANFLALADRGYYDNLRWFRIVPDFVVQTGDPHDDGEGDAGYTIGAEENPVDQRSGVISMGLNYTDGPNPHAIRDSAGTQFYLTISPQYHLDRDFTVFGEVERGFSTLGRLVETDRITRVERLADG